MNDNVNHSSPGENISELTTKHKLYQLCFLQIILISDPISIAWQLKYSFPTTAAISIGSYDISLALLLLLLLAIITSTPNRSSVVSPLFIHRWVAVFSPPVPPPPIIHCSSPHNIHAANAMTNLHLDCTVI